MVRSSLTRKLLRDIRGSSAQFLSILIMIILGVAVFIGLDSTWRSLDDYTSQIREEHQLADIQILAQSITEQDVRMVQDLDGVVHAERRLRLQANVADHPEQLLETIGLETWQLNTVTVHEGSKELKQGEAILDLSFARKNGIGIGDQITIQNHHQGASFKVIGLATSAAYIYTTADATDVIPDHARSGFLMIRHADSAQLTGGTPSFNELLVKTKDHARVEELKNTINTALDSKLIASVTREETRNDMATKQKIAQYKSMGNLFPLVFFAVVILMTFTTMIRLMNTQRKQIGLLKAMGYTRRQIAIHYMSYGLWISVLGSMLGILVGRYVIPKRVWNFFETLFVLPDAPIVLYTPKVIFIVLLSICSTVLAALYVCLRTESEQPSELMRPKLSQYRRPIALERCTSLWGRLRTSWKLIIRQIFRNKIRLFMTVIGVMGCTALLLTALGMRDTIKGVADSVYEKTFLYKAKFYLEDNLAPSALVPVMQDNKVEPIEELSLVISSDSKMKMGTVHVMKKDSAYIHFYGEEGQRLELDDQSVLITSKVAEIHHLAVGDPIEVRIAPNHLLRLKVGAISKVNIGQGLYLSQEAWQAQGLAFQPTAVMTDSIQHTFQEGIVSRMVETEKQSEDFMTSMASTLSLSVMMIAAAGILAFVVLYNLGILNFTERERDLATLLVLGFQPRELRSFVVFENILFTGIGIAIGIPAGYSLHRMIFAKAGMGDELDFTAIIQASSMTISIVLTLSIALAVNVLLLRKVGSIRMAEALKSVE